MVDKLEIDSENTLCVSKQLLNLTDIINISTFCEDCSTIEANNLQKKAFCDADLIRQYYCETIKNICAEIENVWKTFNDIDGKCAF